jgi:hypothetical protein
MEDEINSKVKVWKDREARIEQGISQDEGSNQEGELNETNEEKSQIFHQRRKESCKRIS